MSFPPKAKRSTLLDHKLPHPSGTPSHACYLQFSSPWFAPHVYMDVIASAIRSPWFGLWNFVFTDLWESLPDSIQWGTMTSRKFPHCGDLLVFCSHLLQPGWKYYDSVRKGNRRLDTATPLGQALLHVYTYPHNICKYLYLSVSISIYLCLYLYLCI